MGFAIFLVVFLGLMVIPVALLFAVALDWVLRGRGRIFVLIGSFLVSLVFYAWSIVNGRYEKNLLHALIYITLPMLSIGLAFTRTYRNRVKALFGKEHKSVKSKPITLVQSFYEFASNYIVGQDRALRTIDKTLRTNYQLLQRGDYKKNRVLAVYLFVGPTGVGKTETAKVLYHYLANSGYSFTRIDMNQFQSREAVWTLLGSPKGYVGSDTPGALISALSKNPRQVILFDEIEKAERELYEPLLQLIDEGYVQDRTTGDFYTTDKAVIIFTSNLANQEIGRLVESISDEVELDLKIREILQSVSRGYYAFQITPEFLGRIDAIVPFSPLNFTALWQLAKMELIRLGINDDNDHLSFSLARKYEALAKKYGVRYYLKKITEEVLGK